MRLTAKFSAISITLVVLPGILLGIVLMRYTESVLTSAILEAGIPSDTFIEPLRKIQVFFASIFATIGACFLVAVQLLSRSIISPVRNLTATAKRIADGDLTCPVQQVGWKDEITDLATSFAVMTEKLRQIYDHLEVVVDTRTRQLKLALDEVAKFKQAVDSSTDAIVITDAQIHIIYANDAWQRMTGYSFEEIRGGTPSIIHTEQTPAQCSREMRLAIEKGETYHSEDIVNRRSDGSFYNADLTFYPVREKGIVTFFVGIQHDITRRKRSDRAKSAFVSLASHQLRTPLTGIRWGIGRIRKKVGTNNKDLLHTIDEVHAAARRMSETIGTMLTLSRIESGKLQPVAKPLALLPVFNAICAEQTSHMQKEKLTISIECDKDLLMTTDEAILREILSVLVNNACKYSDEDGHVILRAMKTASAVEISVQDVGIGIPLAQQDKVFERFFRAENAVDRKIEGTGLGLSMAKELVRILGGTLSFQSAENTGTTFTLTIPSPLPLTP